MATSMTRCLSRNDLSKQFSRDRNPGGRRWGSVSADASYGSPCSESCKLREDVVSYLIPVAPPDRFPIGSGVTLFRASGSVSSYIPIPSSRSRVGYVNAMKADGVRSVHIDRQLRIARAGFFVLVAWVDSPHDVQ
jgi:hypothetical protein